MLNEKQAWRYLARNISNGFFYSVGLCYKIRIMVRENIISSKMEDKMIEKLHAYATKRKICKHDFYWSCTTRGAKARFKFCQRMAKKVN